MVPTPPQTQVAEKHIPAWKKLGLRLKYAKEELSPAAVPIGTFSSDVNEKKRKLPLEIPIDTPFAMRPKKSKTETSDKDGTTNPVNSPQPRKSSSSPPITSRESKGRSVSFAPATKAHDGEGVKEYIKRWSASHPERAESWKAKEAGYFQIEPGVEVESEEGEEGSAVRTKKKKKKKKKSKSTTLRLNPAPAGKIPKVPASGPTGTQSTPSKALQYLEHHQSSPSTWKFSKSRQNSLFRSLFSLIEIPSFYDSALLAYLRGLSRTAAATVRVRNMALDIRKGDEERNKTEQGKQDEYAQAVEEMRAGLRMGNLEDLDKEEGPEEDEVKRKEWGRKLKTRRRAEVVLFAVGDQTDPPPTPVSTSASIAAIKPTKTYLNSTSPSPTFTTTTTPTNKPQTHPAAATTTTTTTKTTPFVKPKRKRKTRTLAFSSSSSSSSSSSESSSSSSEKSKREKIAAPKPALVRKKPVWDTSSSDDYDSSSSASE